MTQKEINAFLKSYKFFNYAENDLDKRKIDKQSERKKKKAALSQDL